jgi:glutamine amidotransferase
MGYIGIIDLKSNNSKSVLSAITLLGFEAKFIDSVEGILNADRIVVPGVGHIASIVKEMDELELRDSMIEFASKGNFILGICLGQHLLGLSSEEDLSAQTLGVLDFKTSKLPTKMEEKLRVPHVGWNSIEFDSPHPLFRSISIGSDFYFSHSYAIISENNLTLATTEHSIRFTSVAGEDNLLSVQFHPEKSQKNGAQLLTNFCELQ